MAAGILLISLIVSFLAVLFSMPFWIRLVSRNGLLGRDINKFKEVMVAEGGGIIVIAGFVLGVLVYIATNTFYFAGSDKNTEIFALLTTVLLVVMIGMVDMSLGWGRKLNNDMDKNANWSRGLGRKLRTFLVLFSAIPLMVINAGRTDVFIPLFGAVNLSYVYTLVIVPIGIVGATTTFNFLAGYNGLEAGQGIILLSACALVAYFTGNSWLAIIALCMVGALVAFLFFNFYPAKVFPGDALTYGVGGLIAALAILGNFEKAAVFFFIPYGIETILKLRGRLQMQSFGKPLEDGSLDLRYDKLYGLEHVAIWLMKRLRVVPTEKRVVFMIWGFQIIVILIGLLIFRQGIFGA